MLILSHSTLSLTPYYIAHINKREFTHYYQSSMSLLVTDFTYLVGRDGELVVKELAAVDSHSKSNHIFNIPYS